MKIDIFSYESSTTIHSIENQIIPFHSWSFPFFLLCLLGFFLSLIAVFLLIFFSFHLVNEPMILPNILIGFSVHLIYLVLIVCFFRGNDFLCGLREFLIQLAFVFLFSSFLSEFFMISLNDRIDSKRTRQCLTILFDVLLICIQIPIGILWWHFTETKPCDENHFHSVLSTTFCSSQCLIDERFYATLIYVIFQLSLSTVFGTIVFLSTNSNEQNRSIHFLKNQKLKNSLRFFNLISIDFVWTLWTIFYHFTDRFFLFPSLIFGLFTIGTLSFVVVVIPQLCFYKKLNALQRCQEKTILISNQLAVGDQWNDHEKPSHLLNSELINSGTFLPITRTPRGFFQVSQNNRKVTTIDKLNQLIYGTPPSPGLNSIYDNRSFDCQRQQISPYRAENVNFQFENRIDFEHFLLLLLLQSISSSVTSEFGRSKALPMNSSHSISRRDETIIPILCSSNRHQTTSPVKMRILLKRCSSSAPRVSCLYMRTDSGDLRRPYYCFLSSSTKNSSPWRSSDDSYQARPSCWQTILTRSSDQMRKDYRLLSERLWEMDSDDDQSSQTSNIVTRSNLFRYYSNPIEYDDQSIRHIDEEDENN